MRLIVAMKCLLKLCFFFFFLLFILALWWCQFFFFFLFFLCFNRSVIKFNAAVIYVVGGEWFVFVVLMIPFKLLAKYLTIKESFVIDQQREFSHLISWEEFIRQNDLLLTNVERQTMIVAFWWLNTWDY